MGSKEGEKIVTKGVLGENLLGQCNREKKL
jgi:hypothetical protein